ncbi:MAG: hypothetical protein HY390_04345 [Deltaproteobacteria bacterium]|nr:hypothetical protein [Deltaproteobacteria bacterium]
MDFKKLESNVNALWERPVSHFFISDFSKLMTQPPSAQDLLFLISKKASERCLQNKNAVTPVQSLRHLIGVSELFDFMPTQKNRWLPLVQATWQAVCENRSEVLDIQKQLGSPPLTERLTLEVLKQELSQRKVSTLYPLIVFLLRTPKDRSKVLSLLIQALLSDEAHLGGSVIDVIQVAKFCDRMQWKNYEYFWFPVLHSVFSDSQEIDAYPTAQVFYQNHWKTLLKALHPHGKVFLEADALWVSLERDEKNTTLEKIKTWIEVGYSIHDLWEALKLCSARLVLHSDFHHWASSVAVLLYVEALASSGDRLEPEDQLKAFFMGVLFTKKMMILSKPFVVLSAHPLTTQAQKQRPDVFLEYAIQRGKSEEALGALEALIQQQKVTLPFLELLAFAASKNDYRVMRGQEMRFGVAALKSYQESNHPLKADYLKAFVRLLALEPKDPTMYQALCNTQRIRLGSYAVGGDFNF